MTTPPHEEMWLLPLCISGSLRPTNEKENCPQSCYLTRRLSCCFLSPKPPCEETQSCHFFSFSWMGGGCRERTVLEGSTAKLMGVLPTTTTPVDTSLCINHSLSVLRSRLLNPSLIPKLNVLSSELQSSLPPSFVFWYMDNLH